YIVVVEGGAISRGDRIKNKKLTKKNNNNTIYF
ncbi:hypothetical protein LCGC14_2206250, partial [marine sediment metagenome]